MKRKMCLLLIFLGTVHEAGTAQVSFESSFYASRYKKIIDACIHAWGELRELTQVQDSALSQERETMFKVTLGCLVFADFCLQKMIQERTVVPHEDLLHLLEVIQQLHGIGKQVEPYLSDDQVACIKLVLSGVRSKVEALF
ncbi:MAG: hypothetical protein Q8Q25_01295 [bacterium]|nr:hypothetical protein [bacterium]